MGTNYYARIDECECCDRFDELHLGLSIAGWCFSLHVYPEKGITNLDTLLEFIENCDIVNEYEEKISKKEFLELIKNRTESNGIMAYDFEADSYYKSLDIFLNRINAELGPNNQLRHRIDGEFCIGHGAGTWDYCIGDFS